MFLMFDKVDWFNEFLRGFFGGIDYLVYSLVAWIIEGIFNLANLGANEALVNVLYNRVYVILGVFMIFKISFSFIQYIVSPDAMTDKERGVGKLISRVLITLVMIIICPILFFTPFSELTSGLGGDYSVTEDGPLLSVIQNGVIKTIPKLILGVSDEVDAEEANDYGEFMAVLMLRSFYFPEEYQNSSDYNAITNETNINDLDSFRDSLDELSSRDEEIYKYYYMWPLSTLGGVVMVIILLGIAIDVAIRCFKLIILQMIAPVPIMSYIDPKSSKDGAFASWTKTFISTYLDIFIKLGTVYLTLFLISRLFSDSNGLFEDLGTEVKGGFMAMTFVRVFLIIGLFKFAKDLPKFVKDALGIKDSGGGGGFMGKALSGLAGAAAGFAGGVAAGGLAGGLSGIMSGASAGAAGNPGKAFAQVRDEQAKLLGKTPGGMKGKLQNKAMQRSVMKHTGLNKDTLKAAKKDMIDKQNKANKLLYAYQHDPSSVDYEEVKKAQEAAAKAQSNYESANSLAGQIGLKPNFFEENKRHGAIYRTANRVIANTSIGEKRGYNNLQDMLPGSEVRKENRGIKKYGQEGYEYVRKQESDVESSKAAYDKALGGGFGPISDKGTDVREASANLSFNKRRLKDDKKIFKR